MKYKSADFQQEFSKSGYTPNIQVTTGPYCVTMYSSQSSSKPYSKCSSSLEQFFGDQDLDSKDDDGRYSFNPCDSCSK